MHFVVIIVSQSIFPTAIDAEEVPSVPLNATSSSITEMILM